MYRGLRLVISEDTKSAFETCGAAREGWRTEILDILDDDIKKAMELQAIITQPIISVDNLREIAFPSDDYDVFICHSHADEGLARFLAAFLGAKGLRVFVDSIYWSHYEEILRGIDDKYARASDGTFYS